MKLKAAEHLYGLQALYPTYNITGPFSVYDGQNQERFGNSYIYVEGHYSINYLVFTSKSDPEAIFYQAYEYSVWENFNKKKLRPNQRVEFVKQKFNYSRTNIRSALVVLPEGEPHPLRGYGSFTSLAALLSNYEPCINLPDKRNISMDSLTTRPTAAPKRAYRRTLPEGMEVPERVPCMHCGLPVVLTRNRRYLYIYKNRRNFLHTWCNENFLAKQRAEALNVRRERSLLRKQGAIMPIKFTHYIAKPTLNYKDASTHGEEFFSKHYEDIGKDYIPAQILASVEDSVMLGASESTIIELIKRWLDTKDAMRLHTQGPSFMLFRRIPLRGKASVKEFIHASW